MDLQQKQKKEISPVSRMPDYPKNICSMTREISDVCFLKENYASADVIFVFGAGPRPQFFEKLTQIIHANLAPIIILTGGIVKNRDRAEAHILQDHIIENFGHDKIKIVTEPSSTNTTENVKNALEIHDFSDVKTIGAVSLHYASQRQYQTLATYLPDKKIYPLPYSHYKNENLMAENTWHSHEEGKRLVWGEIMRLHHYNQLGFVRVDPSINEKIGHIFSNLNFTP